MGIDQPVALITGGAGGIGSAICARLSERGFRIQLTSQAKAKAEEAADKIVCSGFQADAYQLDITDEVAATALVRQITDRMGRLDVLVNCAGISYIAPVLMSKPDRWESVLRVNLLGAFIISQAVLRPMMRQQNGRIIQIGSISADVGAPFNAIYAASKAGVAALVRSLALEVARTGITVNGVQPGYVKTLLFEETQAVRAKIKGVSPEQHEQDLIRDTPTGRLVLPQDVAAAVAYLASEDAASVTGQMINVDGGRTAR